MAANGIEEMKIVLREDDVPFFSDEQLQFYLKKNGNKFENAVYECLCVKAEDTTLQISGLSTADSSKYFRRLASLYRPTNSGTLRL